MKEVTVTEKRNSWLADDGREWPTAAEAERSIRAEAAPGVLLVHWRPTTSLGRAIVKAVTGAAK